MRFWSTPILVAVLLCCLLPAAGYAQIAAYTQDFEALVQTDPDALGNDGWLVFGNVFSPDGLTYLYGYGTFPAPNDLAFPAFSQIALLEGGDDQGLQQLVIISDYNNLDHALLSLIESNVFREYTVTADNVGETWKFQFDAKMGNLVAPSTAAAFIKTIDPGNGFQVTNFIELDMTFIPTTWGTYSIELEIDASLVGQLFQIGFMNTATNYDSSGVFYDNVFLSVPTVDAPANSVPRGITLAQNFPNPFNPTTTIAFGLEQPGFAEISIYDVAGRRVATLPQGDLDSGDHTAVWDGRSDSGAIVASGHYRYVLRTAQGQLSRGMTLLK